MPDNDPERGWFQCGSEMSGRSGGFAVDRGGRLTYVRAFPATDRARPMLFTFLLVVHAVIAATLVTVILMQRSEGGGLGMGGSPSGLMSARGAADFLTRATSVLASLFIGMSVVLAVLASTRSGTATIDPTLARRTPAATSIPTAPPVAGTAPFAGAGNAPPVAPADNAAAGNSAVPLAR